MQKDLLKFEPWPQNPKANTVLPYQGGGICNNGSKHHSAADSITPCINFFCFPRKLNFLGDKLHFLQTLLRFEVAEIASWDPANRGQKLHLVWKISQIIIDYLCVLCSPFFTLWPYPTLNWCVWGGGMGGVRGVLMLCCWISARQAVGTDTPLKLH